jgi:hypothetical protein
VILARPAGRRVLWRLGRWEAIPAALTAGATLASTPQAWKAYDAEVLKACLAASSLRNAHAAGQRVDFDDAIGYSALLLAGSYTQPHMKNRSGRELCLFDRRTRTATVSEADAILDRKAAGPTQPGNSSPKPE